MQTISYSEAHSHLSKMMQQVCDDHAPVVVTRTHAKPIVIVSLEDYEAMEETNYLLSSPQNAARLTAAIDEIEGMIATKGRKRRRKKT